MKTWDIVLELIKEVLVADLFWNGAIGRGSGSVLWFSHLPVKAGI